MTTKVISSLFVVIIQSCKQTMLKRILACILCVATSTSFAGEEIEICAKYWRTTMSSWSQGYKVRAYHVDGGDLNSAMNTYKYNSWEKYVVIPWNEGGYSAIKVPSWWSGFEEDAEDQEVG